MCTVISMTHGDKPLLQLRSVQAWWSRLGSKILVGPKHDSHLQACLLDALQFEKDKKKFQVTGIIILFTKIILVIKVIINIEYNLLFLSYSLNHGTLLQLVARSGEKYKYSKFSIVVRRAAACLHERVGISLLVCSKS